MTNLLLERLQRSANARVVTVSSHAAPVGLRTRPENALILGGYTLVALVIGTSPLYRRDTN